jgi:hypothetical protein
MKLRLFQLLISLAVFTTIYSANSKYSLDDILDAATRVKKYVLKNSKLPKIVAVAKVDESMPKFAYAMGIAILNINQNKKSDKIQMINLEAPSTPYKCEIRVYKEDYIDAIKRVVKYCKDNGAAPAYVHSSDINIGYIEYAFGFSKILDFYKTNGQLPAYNEFSSQQIYNGGGSGPIPGVTFKAGINEKNNKKSYDQYMTAKGYCAYDSNVKAKANSLVSGKKTTLEKARAIFNYIRDNIEYEFYSNTRYKATGTYANRRGNCCDKANLVVSMCRAMKIPARYSHAQGCRFSDGVYGHVWAQILVDDIWYAADAISYKNSLGFINNWNIQSFYDLRQYAYLDF